MRAEKPNLPILVLSMHDESTYALRALRAGALGYVMKSEAPDQVIRGIHEILQGRLFISVHFRQRLIFETIQNEHLGEATPVAALSEREREILELIGNGCGTKEIAEQLGISPKTVETHRSRTKEKLRLRDGGEFVRFAMDWVTLKDG